jgi:hypothetical protein
MIKKRKRRSDRRHLIYVLTNTVTGEKYVGMAVCIDRSGNETLSARWCRHKGRALLHDKKWKLCESIRQHGPEVFEKQILQFVRGKAEAHALETQIKNTGNYVLNTA